MTHRRAHPAHRRRGALLLEMIFALAIFVAAASTILIVVRSGVRGLRDAADQQRALDHAASAIARIEAGLASASDLAGDIPAYEAPENAQRFDDAPPAPSGWRLDIETARSDIPGLLVLTATASLQPVGAPADAPRVAATLTALLPLDRAEPPDENPEDERQALFDREAVP